MSGTFVAAYLLRLTSVLDLRRLSSTAHRLDMDTAHNPAVLVIPRGGNMRDPYLVVLARAGRAAEALPSALAVADVHVRARLDTSRGHGWQQMADVLVHPKKWSRHAPAEQMAFLFSRFPGCEILAGRHGRACLLGMRDGRTVEITGSADLGTVGAAVSPAVYGSVLYSWVSADLPLSAMEDAVVIVGLCGADSDEIGQFLVSARAHIHVMSSRARRRYMWPQHLFRSFPYFLNT